MYLSLITLPLLGSTISGFFGRKTGVSGGHIIACLCVIITTVLAVIAFFEVGFDNIIISANLFKWMDSEWFNILWDFQFNSLTVAMLIPVLIISSLVHVYSIGYMNGDPHNQRFFSYLSLFTFMMIILVTANNYLLMFVGWEGVGVCSYLLVSFWFTRIAANQSSISAFLTNRVGDCFLTIGIFAVLWCLGNLDYTTVFSLSSYINENTITIIGICLLIGAMAKSSQVGLHVWLPMAMEGPTPVSALIHAATMVTAGVYLLMRSSPLIEYSSTLLLLCLWLGAITTVFSSLVGLFQQDIKKVIAYSTMSQLGMMVIAIGLSSYNVALFHLINHAFYKGLLFLGAGAVIHAVADNQDFRKYGGLISFLPLSYSVILIASLSLVAFPFMTGFYSKDFILESAYGQYCFSGITVYIIAVIGAIFTTLYSVKVLYLTFLTNPNGSIMYYKHAHESDIFISLPLVILAIFSIFFGFICKDIFVGLGSNFFVNNSLFIHPGHEIMINTEFAVSSFFKLLPFIFTISFILLAVILSEFLSELIVNFKLSILGKTIFGFFNQRFLVEFFYNRYITRLILNLGGQTTKVLDKGSIELLGPYGLEKGLIKLSKGITNLNKGIVTEYGLYNLIGLITLMFIPFLVSLNINTMLLIILSIFIIINFIEISRNNNNNDSLVLQSNFIKVFSSKLIKKIFNKKFLIKAVIIGLVGVTIRIALQHFYTLDIFHDFSDIRIYPAWISIGFIKLAINEAIDLILPDDKALMGINPDSPSKKPIISDISIKDCSVINMDNSGPNNPGSNDPSSSNTESNNPESSNPEPRQPLFNDIGPQTQGPRWPNSHPSTWHFQDACWANRGMSSAFFNQPTNICNPDFHGLTNMQIAQLREEANRFWINEPVRHGKEIREFRGFQFIWIKDTWYEFMPFRNNGTAVNGYFCHRTQQWVDTRVTNLNGGNSAPYIPGCDPNTEEGRQNILRREEENNQKRLRILEMAKQQTLRRRMLDDLVKESKGKFSYTTSDYLGYSYPESSQQTGSNQQGESSQQSGSSTTQGKGKGKERMD